MVKLERLHGHFPREFNYQAGQETVSQSLEMDRQEPPDGGVSHKRPWKSKSFGKLSCLREELTDKTSDIGVIELNIFVSCFASFHYYPNTDCQIQQHFESTTCGISDDSTPQPLINPADETGAHHTLVLT